MDAGEVSSNIKMKSSCLTIPTSTSHHDEVYFSTTNGTPLERIGCSKITYQLTTSLPMPCIATSHSKYRQLVLQPSSIQAQGSERVLGVHDIAGQQFCLAFQTIEIYIHRTGTHGHTQILALFLVVQMQIPRYCGVSSSRFLTRFNEDRRGEVRSVRC
jgi:hypothetical protein